MRKPSRKHRDFEHLIRRKIAGEGFQEGDPLPPTRDFAKSSGLSTSTVYRVLVKLTDENLLRQSANGRFYPNEEERDRKATSNQSFACLLPKVTLWSATLQAILSGIVERSSHYQRGTLLFHEEKLARQKTVSDAPVFASIEEQKELLQEFLKRHKDHCAGIIFDNKWADEAIEAFRDQIPQAVIINRTTHLDFASSVSVDYRLSATLALSHLLATEFRPIYFVTSYEDAYVVEMREALLQVAREIGARLDESHCLLITDGKTRSDFIREICRKHPKPALFCPEENLAQLMQMEAKSQDLPVPKRLGILSGTGSSRTEDAHLSTIHTDFVKVGGRAVDLLRSEYPAEEVISPTLIRRNTT